MSQRELTEKPPAKTKKNLPPSSNSRLPSPQSVANRLQRAAGNQAVQDMYKEAQAAGSVSRQVSTQLPSSEEEAGMCLAEAAESENLTCPSVPDEPVKITFDESRPWLFKAEGDPSYAAIANEIYGSELPALVGFENGMLFGQRMELLDRYVAIPELLLPAYRSEFHRSMRKILAEDIRKIKRILFEWRIDADDEATLISYVKWWAGRRDLRTETDETYFDAFLTRLKEDQWYRDYLLVEGGRQSYLDLLYNEVEERAGELNSIIAQNSDRFGTYRPYVLVHGQGTDIKTEGLHFSINEDSVKRTADLILARMEGYTSEDDSKIIKDALTGLPAPYQAAVLKEIMGRHAETEFFGLLGRYGEPTETGMLFYLFEDLEDKDKDSVAKSLKSGGVLPAEAIDQLIEGRGLAGEYLPWNSHQIGRLIEWSTGKYEERQAYWANKYEESSGIEAAWAFFWGSVVSLWTEETWDKTALILTLGRLGPKLVAALPLTLQKGLLVVGTGVAAYQTTIAIQELATGKDVYSGEELDRADLVARALNVFSNMLFVAAGFMAANQLAGAVPKTPTGKPLFRFRILRADPKSGEYVAIAEDLVHGEYAVIGMDAQTGRGIATNMMTGRSVAIVNGQIQGDAAGLLPAMGAAQEGAIVSTTRALAPSAAKGSALTGGPLSSQLPQPATGTMLLPAAIEGTGGALGTGSARLNMVPAGAEVASFDEAGVRLNEIIRTGGSIAEETRGYGAAIIDVEGYNGPIEIRAISSASTDVLGEGALVVHAPSPIERTLPAARSWTVAPGGGIQHINDAEVKLLEMIGRHLAPNPRGTIHILSLRGSSGVISNDPFPHCPSCVNAVFTFQGDYPEIRIVSHAAPPPTSRTGGMRLRLPDQE